MMRKRIVLLLLLSASTAACSSLLGDFTLGASPSDAGIAYDAGTVDTGGVGQATVRAITADVSVFLGQTATLDASKSTTTLGSLSFAWRVTSVPSGSNLATAHLAGASSATVSFDPDIPGSYVLEVTVRALGASATQSAMVTAVEPQVLFAQGIERSRSSGGAPASARYIIADLDGGNAHSVLCPQFVGSTWNQAQLAMLGSYAGRAFDYWEAPPGQPSKFAAFTLEYSDAGFSTHLWTGTSASTCTAPPATCAPDAGCVDQGSVGFGPGQPFGSEPHFSPDGTRFVVFDQQWRIVTYSADVRSAHVVSTYPVPYGQASSFLDPVGFDAGTNYVIEPPRVTFTASGLAWAQPIVGGWEVVTAPDIPSAVPKTYMTCAGVTPREIAMLPDGTVIASYRQTPQSSENLYQLKPDAQQRCLQEHKYTTLPDSGTSMATDFAVSPDATRIAFVELDTVADATTWMQLGTQLPCGYVNVVSVSGGPAVRVSRSLALYGPRWIGGGTALVFTRLDGVPSSTGRPATSVVVIAPDGGAERVVAQGNGVTTFVSTSGNATCSAVGGGMDRRSSGEGALGVVLALAGLARVRRAWRAKNANRPVHGHLRSRP